MKRASRSNGSRRSPCAHFVRFTEDQNDRLHAVARTRGKTIQGFLHDTAMEAISAFEQQRREAKERREQKREVQRWEKEPLGLGIRAVLEERQRQERALAAPPPPTQPTVQINVDGAPQNLDGQVALLAAYVAGSRSALERVERLRLTTQVLEASAQNPEERHRLVKALEARVSALPRTMDSADLKRMIDLLRK